MIDPRDYRELRAGATERVTDDVQTLTGRPPRAFMAWAREHAPAFAPVASPVGT